MRCQTGDMTWYQFITLWIQWRNIFFSAETFSGMTTTAARRKKVPVKKKIESEEKLEPKTRGWLSEAENLAENPEKGK